MNRHGSLELEEDLRFQQSQWRSAEVLWLVLLAVMVATGLGAFGGGPLTRVEETNAAAGLRVQYPGVVRFGSSMRLVVHAAPQPDGISEVALSRSLVDAHLVVQVTPAPVETASGPDGVVYRFRAISAAPVVVVYELQPAVRWRVDGQVRSPRGAVQIRQYILP